MKNRLLDYFMAPSHKTQPSPASLEEWGGQAQDELAYWFRQVENYVKEHPAVGIGATFTMGVILGWLIKRR